MLTTLFNLPVLCFLGGVVFKNGYRLPPKVQTALTVFLLFSIGLKGGAPLMEQALATHYILILALLILWGLVQPILAFFLLKTFTQVDRLTAVAISASFGSVSVMTFAAGVSYLEQMGVPYHELILAALALMEMPAIISGVFIAKWIDRSCGRWGAVLKESLLNKALLSILMGMGVGMCFPIVSETVLWAFKPLLCLFLFDMGLVVGSHRKNLQSFSWALNLFAVYMPLIGGFAGLLLSYIFRVDVGTATLISILTASASYIAVPAAMRMVLPQAKESIYLPLSLGIAFPFNVLVGIPLYYYLAHRLLGS